MFARSSGTIVRITLDIHRNRTSYIYDVDSFHFLDIQGQTITDSTKCKRR